MAKNPYAKTVKLFSKSADLFIQRVGDIIFISEGHIIVKMHIAAYNAFFRPVSGRFIELTDGEKAGRRGGMALPEKHEGVDIEKIFTGAKTDSIEPVNVSPFLMEYSLDGKKKLLQRMLTGRGYYVAVNNDFYDIANEIGFSVFTNAGKSISGIFADSGSNGIFILPIRPDQQKIDSFINVTK